MAQLKRRSVGARDAMPSLWFPHGLATGRIRANLLPVAKRLGPRLASHDPDGHLFAVGTAHNLPGLGIVCGEGTRRTMT